MAGMARFGLAWWGTAWYGSARHGRYGKERRVDEL